MVAPHQPDPDALPLRERLPEYLIVFGLGLVATAVCGGLASLLSDATFAAGFGYSLVILAMYMLLSGGLSGGGYRDLGAGLVGTLLSSRSRPEEGEADFGNGTDSDRRQDARARLRRGLRPEANPRATWQVIGGFGYFALGTWIVLQFAS